MVLSYPNPKCNSPKRSQLYSNCSPELETTKKAISRTEQNLWLGIFYTSPQLSLGISGKSKVESMQDLGCTWKWERENQQLHESWKRTLIPKPIPAALPRAGKP